MSKGKREEYTLKELERQAAAEKQEIVEEREGVEDQAAAEDPAGSAGEASAAAGEQAEALARRLSEQQDMLLRLAAEYDNYRKRTAKEKESIYADAKIETLAAMLPVYDNLERALSQFGEDDGSPHRKGVEMIFTQFRECLARLGVTVIDAVGRPFDPEKHSAVMHIEDETLGENVVAEVLQQGFMLGDKVLRFATVKVAN